MKKCNYSLILFQEIVAEGLEGITLESLWEHLKDFKIISNIDDYKEYFWQLIVEFKNINFYELAAPRHCNFKIQNLRKQFDMEKNCFIPTYESFEQDYTCALVDKDDIFGSCESYSSRVIIDHEIKNQCLTYSNVKNRYGDTLVIVADEKSRKTYLYQDDYILSKQQYAYLEYIGRYRRNGLIIPGISAAPLFIKDAKVAWYQLKKMKSRGLIRIQKIEIMNSNSSIITHQLIHLSRLYRPYCNIFEQKLEKLYLHVNTIQCKSLHANMCLKFLNVDQSFLTRAIQYDWIDVITTTYRKLNESCHLPRVLSDSELWSLYIEDCLLPRDTKCDIESLYILTPYIRLLKSPDDLHVRTDDVASLPDTVNDQDSVKALQPMSHFNIDEPLDIQLLYMLAHQPMSMNEIRRSFGNIYMQRIVNQMISKRQICVSYKSKEKHSVTYYSISKLTDRDQHNLPALPPNGGMESEIQNKSFKDVNPMIRNPKRKDRYKLLVDFVRSELVIPGLMVARRYIIDWEKSKNILGIMDRKSFNRILNDAIVNKEIETLDVTFDGIHSEIWLVSPGTTRECAKFQEHYDNKLTMLDKKARLFTIVTASSENVINSSKKKKKKKKKKKGALNDDPRLIVDILNDIRNVGYDTVNLQDFKFPELPIMVKTKILHEFIWYISIGWYSENNNCHETKFDENNFKIYCNEDNWKKYVAPLSPDFDEQPLSFGQNDILSRMPLAMLCMITSPKECNQSLFEHLSDESLALQTIGNIVNSDPSVVAFLLNHRDKRCRMKLADLLECLVNMGSLDRLDTRARHREHVTFCLNKEVFLTDTTNCTLPNNDEMFWQKLPRSQWVLRTTFDVVNYWDNVFSICTGTRTRMGYRTPGIALLSREYSSSMRNADYIRSKVTKNGRLLPDHIVNIRQFGAWLPIDSLKWKNMSAGGFYGSVMSWNILNWCHNRFDKSLSLLPGNIAKSMKVFRTTIFNDLHRDKCKVKYLSTLNENLSCILNEINIVLVAANVLQYDTNIELFWSKIRKCHWFRTAFPLITPMKIETINAYRSLLTPEYASERQYLEDLFINNDLIKHFIDNFRKKSDTKDNWVHELAIIRMLLLQLMKIHQFIPQWDSLPQNGNSIGDLVDEMKASNLRLRTRLEEAKKAPPPPESTKKIIQPDQIDTVNSVMNLTLMKYLMGCMRPYDEYRAVDMETRNSILRKYRLSDIVDALNSFANFYVFEPIKSRNLTMHQLTDKYLDGRLRKYSNKFIVQTKYLTHQDLTISKYMTWSEPPVFDGRKAVFKSDLDTIEMKDLLFSFNFLYLKTAQGKSINSMEMNLNPDSFIWNDKKHKTKTVCHSSVYGLNLKHPKLTEADWTTMTRNASLTVTMGKGTFNALYNVKSRTDVWDRLTRVIKLKSDDSEPETKKLRHNCNSVHLDKVLTYITEGEFGGRNYLELKKKFPDTKMVNEYLENLLCEEEIYVVGMNSFHFVSKTFIRPWLVKVAPSLSTDGSVRSVSSRDRKREHVDSSADEQHMYFIPEFYLDETAQFKCVTFKEIINKIYLNAQKTCGSTLADLMADMSSFLGVTVIRQLMNVLVEYNVIILQQIQATGRAGLFSRRVKYRFVDTSPFDNEDNITVHVNPLGNLNMSQLIRDMSKYFCVNFQESVQCLDQSTVMMDES